MSIHEYTLDGDGSEGDDGAADAEVKLGDLEALRGVVKFPVRIKCATLSWNTLPQGLDESAEVADRLLEGYSPSALLMAAASSKQRSLIPPSAWLTMSITTRFHEFDQSGW